MRSHVFILVITSFEQVEAGQRWKKWCWCITHTARIELMRYVDKLTNKSLTWRREQVRHCAVCCSHTTTMHLDESRLFISPATIVIRYQWTGFRCEYVKTKRQSISNNNPVTTWLYSSTYLFASLLNSLSKTPGEMLWRYLNILFYRFQEGGDYIFNRIYLFFVCVFTDYFVSWSDSDFF